MATGTIILPVLAAVPDATNPPGLAFSTTDSVPYLTFDAGTTNEVCYWSIRLPANYASGPLLQIQWSNAASDTGNCRWGCQVAKVTPNSDTDDMTGARTFDATENIATDAGVATRRLQEVQMTLTNFDSAAAGDNVTLKFYRDSSDAGDTMNTDDAYLWQLVFEYTTS